MPSLRKPSSLLLFCALVGVSAPLLCPGRACAQEAGGRVVLVLPFDNRSGDPSVNWIGDSFPDTLNKRLNSAGFLTISRDDRAYALDHLGLPADFRPSRATTIRIAQQLDANFVIIGSYTLSQLPGSGAPAAPGNSAGAAANQQRISIQAQVLDIDALRLSPPVQDSAELNRLFDAENAVAWKVARTLDPHFSVAEATFLAASGGVPLPAFEDYIRGANAPNTAESLRRLKAAVALAPEYSAALLALGKQEYAARDYAAAAATLARVPAKDRLALEANFYLGLARFNSADYAGAEHAFQQLAAGLPLPEIVNDEGVALSRQGQDGSVYFRRAVADDPSAEDFHYNLAVSLYRKGDAAGALKEVDAALKLKPSDNEALQLRAHLVSVPVGSRPESTGAFLPVERIRRDYNEASFRQAAFQLDQLRALRLAQLPPAQRAIEYTQLGQGYFAQGLLPEAETQFQAAIAADAGYAPAHTGIAQVREASGDAAQARAEASLSLKLQPTALAWLVLCRLDLAANQLAAAAADASHAMQLEPTNTAASALRNLIQQRMQSAPRPATAP